MNKLPYSRKSLRESGSQRSYASKHREAAFLLGGIGTGNVSLGSRGEFRDWEIFNRSAKGQQLPYAFFSIIIKNHDGRIETRVLESKMTPPFTESHGFHPSTTAGLPRFDESSMRGEYPFCWVELSDDKLPVKTEMEAYTPFIPHEPDDSGLPIAVITYNVRNVSSKPIEVTIVGSLTNVVGFTGYDQFGALRSEGFGGNVNEFRELEGLKGLYFWSKKHGKESLQYGSLALVSTNANVTHKKHWLRSGWWDLLREFWDDLQDGELSELGYSEPSEDMKTDVGSLGICEKIEPSESKQFRFILSWFFPNRLRNWNQRKCSCGSEVEAVRNRYAKRFENAWDVSRYVVSEFERLDSSSRMFHDALFSSTLPSHVIDAIASNITVIRSSTCFWLEDGTFLGYEGCFDDAGCCSGNCTHVWNYAQTLAYLFPSLERSMRETEFRVETDVDGRMSFRAYRAFPGERSWDTADPAIDGQCGSIMRVFREWKLCGDTDWMAGLWPQVRKSMEYCIMTWDPNQDGVTDGRQHNTYDIQFFGPNPLSGIIYLGSLKAASKMAEASGDYEYAEYCNLIFEKGRRNLDKTLWNREYYVQRLADVDSYKYQHGLGCLSDQLLGQLNANLYGLGYLLPPRKIRKTIQTIYRNNFLTDFRLHDNCQRAYVLNDEKGLLTCTWPIGGRPKIPFPYSHEVWTGIEYHVASHLILEGFVDEGLAIVKAVRDRHDGIKRNPWNEVECGHHYARSMASWGLLLALSGFECDMASGKISFNPKINADNFKTFWSTGTAWGIYRQKKNQDTGELESKLEVLHGNIPKKAIRS